jgi:hypothetical protein
MAAAEVVDTVSAMADIPAPTSERQARELAPLRKEPEQLRQAWTSAVDEAEGEQPTAAQVARAVERVRPKPTPRQTRPSEPTPAPVPAMPDWQRSRPMLVAQQMRGMVGGEDLVNVHAIDVMEALATAEGRAWVADSVAVLKQLADQVDRLLRVSTDAEYRELCVYTQEGSEVMRKHLRKHPQ